MDGLAETFQKCRSHSYTRKTNQEVPMRVQMDVGLMKHTHTHEHTVDISDKTATVGLCMVGLLGISLVSAAAIYKWG